MSQKANPTSIGMFVVLGLALGVAGLLLFSSRSLLHPHHKDILYFNTSLKGLNPGAPVKFRGVTIGTVAEVLIRHNQASNDFSMPVVISIDMKLAQSKSDEQLEIGSQAKLEQLIQQGLRGGLEAESLVTGVLYVGLDIIEDAPPPHYHQLTPEYHEIPTMPTQVQRLLSNLAKFDAGALLHKVSTLTARLDTSFGQLDIPQINAGVTNLLGAANQLIAAPDLTNSLGAIRRTMNSAEALLKRIDGRVDPLADNVTNTLYQAQEAFADLRRGLQNLTGLLGPDAVFRSDLAQALGELGNASRAVADLAEFLEHNPNALLTGRKRPKEEP